MKRAKLALIFICAAWVCAPGYSAQDNQGAQDSPGSEPSPTITQERSYSDGHVGEVHLVQEKVEWSDALHGYLVTVRAKEEEPALISLDPGDLKSSDATVKTVQSQDKFTAIDLQTDIKLLQVIGKTDAGQPILEYSGKLTVAMIPPSNISDGQAKLFPMAGRAGTRIDLSALFDRKQEITFLGRSWRPTTDKQAIMVVGKNAIEIMNVKVINDN